LKLSIGACQLKVAFPTYPQKVNFKRKITKASWQSWQLVLEKVENCDFATLYQLTLVVQLVIVNL
jgi:hypothetical protein